MGERGQCYMRVGELPFKVSREISNWLSEGDDVIVSYWSRGKKVARVDKVRRQNENADQ